MKEQNNLRDKAITVLELTKGFTPEQRKGMGNLLTTMEELAGDVMVQAQDWDELRNKVIEEAVSKFEQAIKEINPHAYGSAYESVTLNKVIDFLNSLKTK